VEGRGSRLLASGQPPEKTVLRRRGLVTFPVLNQEHPLIPHVTSPTACNFSPLLTLTIRYNINFGNAALVLDARLFWTFFVSENKE